MNPVAILIGQALVVLLGVVILWVVARRRLPARWSAIWWGVLTFPLSQVARFALVIPLTLLLEPALGPAFATANAALLVLTSGLFEETARWVVLRYWATRVRDRASGVAFGLGHGGIEAILLMGNAAVGGIVTLMSAETIRGAVAANAPDQLAAFEAQLTTLQGLTVGLSALAIYERVLAIALHVVLSLIVLHGIRTAAPRWWALAVVLHCVANATTVGVAAAGAEPVAVEGVLTVVVLAAAWAVWRGPWSAVTRPAAGERVSG